MTVHTVLLRGAAFLFILPLPSTSTFLSYTPLSGSAPPKHMPAIEPGQEERQLVTTAQLASSWAPASADKTADKSSCLLRD